MTFDIRMCGLQVAQGTLWIWPQTGADALLKASQKPLPITEQFDGPSLPVFSADFNYFRAAANWSLLLENAMDPTHAASLHEGRMGQRKDMVSPTCLFSESQSGSCYRVK